MFKAPYKEAGQPAPSISGFDFRNVFTELTEHDLGFQPGERSELVQAITVALERIQSDPMRQMIMGLSAGRDLTELPSSPVLGRIAADLTGITDDDPQAAQ